MENNEILERLRGYNFFKINFKYEYEERLEKFLILASKTNKFQLENGNLLNYEIIKKLLKKKNVRMVRDIEAFRKLKLQEIVKENLATIKWRILDDLNAIFREDNLKFSFNKNSSDEIIEEQPSNLDKTKIENHLEVLRYYYFNKVKTGLVEEYEDRLGRLLLLAKKSKSIKFIDEDKEEQELNYETVVSLMEKKGLSLQMSKIKFNQNSSLSMDSYLATSESYRNRIAKDLNKIFEDENITFELIKQEEEKPVTFDKLTITERLEKLLIFSGKSKMIMVKNLKQLIDYEVALSLLKKKGLKMQSDKRTFINGHLSDSGLNRLKTQKYDIVNDLNIIYKNEDIEFCLVDEIDNFIPKTLKNEIKDKNELTEKSNIDLIQEIALLKESMNEIKELVKNKENSYEQSEDNFTKIDIEIPDFIKNMDNYDVISIKGNKEYYNKFKRFATLHGIPICHLMNYLFYYAMEKLGRE